MEEKMSEHTEADVRRFVWFLFILFICSGSYGATWVSDEFDSLRLSALAFVGVPLATAFLLLAHLAPGWQQRYATLYRLALVVIIAHFAWGNILLVNAFAADDGEQIVAANIGSDALDLPKKKGGLGIYYETRW